MIILVEIPIAFHYKYALQICTHRLDYGFDVGMLFTNATEIYAN